MTAVPREISYIMNLREQLSELDCPDRPDSPHPALDPVLKAMLDVCTDNLRCKLLTREISDIVTRDGDSTYIFHDEEFRSLLRQYQGWEWDARGRFDYYLQELKSYMEDPRAYMRHLSKAREARREEKRAELQSDLSRELQYIEKMRKIISDYDSGIRYEEGDFSCIVTTPEAEMLTDHFHVAKELGLQDFFMKATSNYLFSSAPEVQLFISHPRVDKWTRLHSGTSIAFMCRKMQTIFQLGWNVAVQMVIDEYKTVVAYKLD